MAANLKLCPFCGGPARFGNCVPGEQEGENDGAEYVECCDCGASTCLVFPLMDSAKQVLRDMWNRRTDARHEPPNVKANRPALLRVRLSEWLCSIEDKHGPRKATAEPAAD